MALLFCDGLDGYSNGDQMDTGSYARWNNSSGATLVAAGSKWGGKCVEIDVFDSINSFNTDDDHVGVSVVGGPIHFAFWVNLYDYVSTNAAERQFIRIDTEGNNGSFNITSYPNDKTKLTVNKFNSFDDLGNFDHGMSSDTWHHFEIVLFVSTTGTGYVKIWIDELLRFDYSGATADSAATHGFNQLMFSSFPPGDDVRFDDFILWDESGSEFTHTQLGKHRIQTLMPNANGDSNTFSASPNVDNYLNVDEDGFRDSDNTYNHTIYDGALELYGFSDLGRTPTSIYGVMSRVWARKTGDNPEIKLIVKSNGVEVDGGLVSVTANTFYQFFSYFREKNTSNTSWVGSEIDAIQAGIDTNEDGWEAPPPAP